jgi:tetratricopeptide (TPR) repeat protein
VNDIIEPSAEGISASTSSRSSGKLDHSMTARPDRKTFFTVAILIVFAVAFAYWQVHSFEFNNYDDVLYVTGNDTVKRGLTAEGIVAAFTGPMAANWHPLTMVSHMLDVELFGLNAGAHHLVNVCFHLANSLLLFWVMLKMTRRMWPSAAVALIFAVHPLHVESVAWVAERKDVLSAFFGILTLWAYARYAARSRIADYLLVVFFLAAGLLSKPMLVTWPILLFLFDYWPLCRLPFSPEANESFPRQPLRRVVLEKIPLLLLALASSVATIVAQSGVRAVAPLDHFPLSVRLANAIVSYTRYIAKTLWPLDLSFHYEHAGLWPLPIVIAALVLLLILSAAAITSARRFPWLPVGWLWFLVSLVPVIGLVQVGGQAMADRYMYLPLIGLSIIAAWGVQEFVRSDLKFFIGAVGLIVALALTLLTRAQAQHWRTSETLYAHGLQRNWNSATAHRLLARTLSERGDQMGAIRHYSEAVRVLPHDELLHYNLGIVLIQIGDIARATNHLATSLQFNPTNTSTRVHLARCFSMMGQRDPAISNCVQVLKAEPHDYLTRIFLGHLYLEDKRTQPAMDCFAEAVRQRPDSAEAQDAYGVGLLKTGSVSDAIPRLREATKLNPSFAPAHRHLAQALLAQGNARDAITSYQKAIDARPNFAEAMNDLAWLLATHPDDTVRNGKQAVEVATRACDLTKYQQPVPLITLAAAHAEAGHYDEATALLQRATAIAQNAQVEHVVKQAEEVSASIRNRKPYRSQTAAMKQ